MLNLSISYRILSNETEIYKDGYTKFNLLYPFSIIEEEDTMH